MLKKFLHIERFKIAGIYKVRVSFLSLILQLLLLFSFLPVGLSGQIKSNLSGFTLGRLKYSGGGDWYNDPSADENLMKFIAKNTNINTLPKYTYVDLASDDIFSFPILFLTGHGNVNFSPSEVDRLRRYLNAGGFLYIDDDYGLDPYIRKEMKKVFPDKDFVELPATHPLFNIHYKFPDGVPKIHEHDNKAPQTFAIYNGQKIAVLYTYESNPSDGWADPEVHHDSEEKRQEALKFGVNLVIFALTQ